MCEVNLMLTCDGLRYFNISNDHDLIDLPEDAVIVDGGMVIIPLQHVLKPCELPSNLYYYGMDDSLHTFTTEVSS